MKREMKVEKLHFFVPVFFAKQQLSPSCVIYRTWAKSNKFQTRKSLMKDFKRAINISSCLFSLLLQALILFLTLVGVDKHFLYHLMQHQLQSPAKIMAAFILAVLGKWERMLGSQCLTKEWVWALFGSFAVACHNFSWFYTFYP